MENHHSGHHVVPPKVYLAVFAALVVLTVITVWAAFMTMPDPWHDVVAMAIAVTKATLVVLFFMHAKYGTRMTKLSVISSVIFLVILLGITVADFWARNSQLFELVRP
jgi:cytochrome c oxidase subunit IV